MHDRTDAPKHCNLQEHSMLNKIIVYQEFRPVARIFFWGGVRSLERKGYFFLCVCGGGGEASTGV